MNSQSSQEKIKYLLKSRGPQTAITMAKELNLTSMGVRQHLLKLFEAKLLSSYLQAEGKGRPKRYWQLTPKGHAKFPDRHSDLTLELIDSIESVFGEKGLEQLIEVREKSAFEKYQQQIEQKKSLAEKIKSLAKIRSEEGYMATVIKEKDHFLMIENHCPICAAASQCQNFCRSELNMFQELLQNIAEVSRSEHILEGARRCAYVIKAKQ